MKKNSSPSAKRALQLLKDGNRRFAKERPVYERHDAPTRQALVGGQSPYAVVLSCADSRVIPELLFDAGIGDIFVVRVAGNVANTETVASIEYAVANLNVNLVVVLGHENCGAVNAALNDQDYGHNLNMLLAHIKPAVPASTKKVSDRTFKNAIKKNARLHATNLRERSAILSKKSLQVVPAFYNLGTGKVDWL